MTERDWTSIDELVAQYMADPEMLPHIIAARKAMAPVLFPNGGPDYERLLRGEGPPDQPAGDE